ncbi:hypothetical protein BHE74_00025368 [Ensete ventricosum]|nr:hypothetical protein BHE74_00025368 [Ensete ventricosum]RZS18273.1 hypothetical protein BHM03_00050493 [Ensete ventricosum]
MSFYSGCCRLFVPDDLTAFMAYHTAVSSTMLAVLAMRRAFAGGGCRPYLCQVGCTTTGAPRISGRLPAQAARVAEAACAATGNSSSVAERPTQNAVTCFYRTVLSTHKELLTRVVWWSKHHHHREHEEAEVELPRKPDHLRGRVDHRGDVGRSWLVVLRLLPLRAVHVPDEELAAAKAVVGRRTGAGDDVWLLLSTDPTSLQQPVIWPVASPFM